MTKLHQLSKMNERVFRICVFASGKGSNLKSIYKAIEAGKLDCKIDFVLSNNSNSGALEFARQKNIPAIHLSEKNFHKTNFEDSLIDVLDQFQPDLIVLAGYMKLIPNKVIERYTNKIINIHPALLPKYGGKGMFGLNVHKAVFESGDRVSGVTIHIVNENYDEGKIIYQEIVDISDCTSPEEIAEKVLSVEHRVYPEVIQQIIDGKIKLTDTDDKLFTN